MGNSDLGRPVAKPCVERPSSMGGFRREWESLLRLRNCTPEPSAGPKARDRVDLWRHLVASHHGHLRPWLADRVLERHALGRDRNRLRNDFRERAGQARIQCPHPFALRGGYKAYHSGGEPHRALWTLLEPRGGVPGNRPRLQNRADKRGIGLSAYLVRSIRASCADFR